MRRGRECSGPNITWVLPEYRHVGGGGGGLPCTPMPPNKNPSLYSLYTCILFIFSHTYAASDVTIGPMATTMAGTTAGPNGGNGGATQAAGDNGNDHVDDDTSNDDSDSDSNSGEGESESDEDDGESAHIS